MSATATTTDSLTSFLRKKCGMSLDNATKMNDGLKLKKIDGVKIAAVKARKGTLKRTLQDVAADKDVDQDYVGVIMSELAKDMPNIEKDDDEKLDAKKETVEAALKAASDYRQAVAGKNQATINDAYTALDAALKQVAPDAGWNVPLGENLVPQLDKLITDITSLEEVVNAGNYLSDFEMLTHISEGALRKASIFLPGRPIGHRALMPFFGLPDSISAKVLSETRMTEKHFSNNDVKATYLNDLTTHGSANTFDAEIGGFFGVFALAASGSYSEGSAWSNSSRINTLTEAREAVGIRTHSIAKAYVTIEPDEILFSYKDERITTVHAAKNFFDTYGTHLIVAPQVLGGLYLLESKVTFDKEVSQASYTNAIAKTLRVSAGLSGWGLIGDALIMGSAAGAHDSESLKAQASGTTSAGDKYTAVTTISQKGPSCVNAASFRASLDNGNKSWGFINNGLKMDKLNCERVVHQIVPVWDLFDRAGRFEDAVFLRKTWLDIVLNADAILDSHSFFGQLVDKTLLVDSLTSDRGRDWTAPFVSKMTTYRTPVVVYPVTQGETSRRAGRSLLDLSAHQVGWNGDKVLTQFQLRVEGTDSIHYDYTDVLLRRGGQLMTAHTTEFTTGKTPGPQIELAYLDRLYVHAPVGQVLAGFFLLHNNDSQLWYKCGYSQMMAGDVKFSYRESDVQRSVTEWSDGAFQQGISMLDKQNVRAPAGHLLVGFRLLGDGAGKLHYEFWHVPASALVPEEFV